MKKYRYERFYIVKFGNGDNRYKRLKSDSFFGIEEGARKLSKDFPSALECTHVTGHAAEELRKLYHEKDELENSKGN